MSGIRKIQPIVCPSCGAHGQVGLGMAMIGARSDHREFACAACNGIVPFTAPRAIVGVDWNPVAIDKSAGTRPAFND